MPSFSAHSKGLGMQTTTQGTPKQKGSHSLSPRHSYNTRSKTKKAKQAAEDIDGEAININISQASGVNFTYISSNGSQTKSLANSAANHKYKATLRNDSSHSHPNLSEETTPALLTGVSLEKDVNICLLIELTQWNDYKTKYNLATIPVDNAEVNAELPHLLPEEFRKKSIIKSVGLNTITSGFIAAMIGLSVVDGLYLPTLIGQVALTSMLSGSLTLASKKLPAHQLIDPIVKGALNTMAISLGASASLLTTLLWTSSTTLLETFKNTYDYFTKKNTVTQNDRLANVSHILAEMIKNHNESETNPSHLDSSEEDSRKNAIQYIDLIQNGKIMGGAILSPKNLQISDE